MVQNEKKKNQSIKTELEITPMLTNKDIKTVIIIIFHLLKKAEERLSMFK